MMNRRMPFQRHGRLYVLAGLVMTVSVFLLLLDCHFPATILAPSHDHWQIRLAAAPEAKSAANMLDQDHRKKKKKNTDDDDEDNNGTRVKGARPVQPFNIPALVPGRRYAYFIAMGDWGTGDAGQRRVAELMNAKAGRDSLQFVLLLGDNFYEKGVASVSDPQWQKKFEQMYDLPSLHVPFFAALGNHDYKKSASPQAQIEYSKRNTKWQMPARYYTFTRNLGQSASIQFFALDTDVFITSTSRDLTRGQLEWFESELAKSKATWKVVFGHHPVFSNGNHGDTPEIKQFIQPLLEKYHVDFYLCGHDHDRQFLQPVAGVHYIVSGTGAKSRNTEWASNTIFAASDLGFTWYRVSADEFHVQFIDKNSKIEFAYTLNKANQKSVGNSAGK